MWPAGEANRAASLPSGKRNPVESSESIARLYSSINTSAVWLCYILSVICLRWCGAMGYGDVLRQLREEAGLSQNALARAAGLDPTHLNRLEREKQGPPRRATAIKLVRALGLSLSDPRAERLLAAFNLKSPRKAVPPAVLGSPLNAPAGSIKPTVRRLKGSLIQALDLVTELEELLEDLDDEEE